MLPIPQEYVGSMCEIKSMSNDHLSVGRVIKIDHDALEISAGADGFMQLLQYRYPVKLFVHNSTYEDRILVGLTYLSTDNFLRVEEVQNLVDFERRGAFRVNARVVGKLFALMTEEEGAAFDKKLASLPPLEADLLLAKTKFEAMVVDVSLTGVQLRSPHRLRVDEKYGIEFTLVKEALTFFIRVERLIQTPDGQEHYGCSFFDVSERQMDSLCRDLFQMQRLEKNRRRNTAAQI